MSKYNYLVGFIFVVSLNIYADETHFKNMLIGGRAATMAGAYTAISDDASGTFYNPAGMALTTSNSISGSAKVWNSTATTYKETIGTEDWNRKSEAFLANFFGVVKKIGTHTLALSYSIPDSTIEHQDQEYKKPISTIDTFYMNLHSEDTTNLISLAYANYLTSNFSYGLVLSYSTRLAISTMHQLVEKSDGTDELTYTTTTYKENGMIPKLGVLLQLSKFSFGLTVSKNIIVESTKKSIKDFEDFSSSDNALTQASDLTKRKTPLEISTGIAYFQNSSLLYSFDFDYFIASDPKNIDIWNISFGTEYYINRTNALRAGLYTNNSNQPTPSSKTVTTQIDMYGVTCGYTNFAKESSITLGLVYSVGSGKSQPYGVPTIIKDIDKQSLSVVMSADYGF